MPFDDFRSRSLQSYMLRRFLPLIVLSITIVTGWALYAVYLSAWYGGKDWAHTSIHRFQSEASTVGEEVELARAAALNGDGSIIHGNLPETYSLIEAASPIKEQFPKAGVYNWQGHLSYVLPLQTREKDGQKDWLLIRRMQNSFVDRISAAIGTEIQVLLIEPEPHVYASSWKDLEAHRVFPALSEDLWKKLNDLPDAVVLSGEGIFDVPRYRGLHAQFKLDSAWDRGEDRVHAFYAFAPIENPLGRRIGYFGVIIPEAAVFVGVSSGMLLASIFAIIVAALSVWLILRTARRVSLPISTLSKRILKITEKIAPETAIAADELPRPVPPVTANEIETLRYGVDLLANELARVELAKQIVHRERERSHFASKMAALGEMSASVAHEINNPVAVIHALADELNEKAMQGGPTGEDTARMAKEIKGTAVRVAAIIRALLKISRDSETDPMEWHSMESLVDDALILVRDQMKKQGIKLEVSGLENPILVMCRGTQITQVILNLLTNAMDALEISQRKLIELQVARGANSVWVSIIDSGPGISERVRTRLMEPFVTTKPPGRGTGLGLSISKHIVGEHYGKLFFDRSKYGTRFVFGLPIDQKKTNGTIKPKEPQNLNS
jgi:signal transduction histidine kinase